MNWILEQQWADPQGRFLYVKGKLEDEGFTFANYYFTNSSQMDFLERRLEDLMEYADGKIIGGDFNVALIPWWMCQLGLRIHPTPF